METKPDTEAERLKIEQTASAVLIQDTPTHGESDAIKSLLEGADDFQLIYIREKNREDRASNLAAGAIEIVKRWLTLPVAERSEKTHVTLAGLRKSIREQLDMPALEGQAHLGDLRATGDAAGCHGIGLEMEFFPIQGKRTRAVALNAANVNLCIEFLRKPPGQRLVAKAGSIPAHIYLG